MRRTFLIRPLIALGAMVLAGCATSTYTPRKTEVPAVLPSGEEARRITDSRIRADLDWIEGLQGRIEALNDRGAPVESHDLARAQCWLSFGLEEYHENDRTGVIEAALAESQRIVAALEAGQPAGPTASPIATAVKLRPDLWARLEALQAAPGLRCAAEQAACLEVALNHAGHEYAETGWRHARGTIAEAERLAAEGATRAAACRGESDSNGNGSKGDGDGDRDGVPDSRDRCPRTPPPARVDVNGCEFADEIRLPGVNFETASAALLPESFAVLDEAVATLQRYPELGIEVAGHTDSRASDAYNLALSQRRAEAVRAYLLGKGVRNPLTAKGYGEAQPIAPEATEEGRRQNRRVVLHILP